MFREERCGTTSLLGFRSAGRLASPVEVDSPLVLRSVAGPDSGWSRIVPPGRVWIGRAAASVTTPARDRAAILVADPAVEAHHALLEVGGGGGGGGAARVLQVEGRAAVRIDGEVARGWTELPPGSSLELGHSRLVTTPPGGPSPSPPGPVYAPLDESAAEMSRFERDLRRAVDAGVAVRELGRIATTVSVGVGRSSVHVELRDGAGGPVDPFDLGHAAQAIVERATFPVTEVMFGLDRGVRLGVAAPYPDAVIASMLGQVCGGTAAPVVVVEAADAAPYETVDRPIIVSADAIESLPPWCTAILDVGATWWATWQPDAIDRPNHIVRLHARGQAARASRHEPTGGQLFVTPTGRSSLSR
jgi:hypothetical protein